MVTSGGDHRGRRLPGPPRLVDTASVPRSAPSPPPDLCHRRAHQRLRVATVVPLPRPSARVTHPRPAPRLAANALARPPPPRSTPSPRRCRPWPARHPGDRRGRRPDGPGPGDHRPPDQSPPWASHRRRHPRWSRRPTPRPTPPPWSTPAWAPSSPPAGPERPLLDGAGVTRTPAASGGGAGPWITGPGSTTPRWPSSRRRVPPDRPAPVRPDLVPGDGSSAEPFTIDSPHGAAFTALASNADLTPGSPPTPASRCWWPPDPGRAGPDLLRVPQRPSPGPWWRSPPAGSPTRP